MPNSAMAVPMPQEQQQARGTLRRIVLIRHGQPAIALAPRTGHRGFRAYLDDYEDAGLDPANIPPAELRDLAGEISTIFTSGRRRSDESARALAPHAEIVADPLFAEAPLASPQFPLLRMTVTKWAVVSRILWHAGFHPGIESYRQAKSRSIRAANMLVAQAEREGAAVLVAHGYFNFLIGQQLRLRGFHRSGSHRARYWNAVTYVSHTAS